MTLQMYIIKWEQQKKCLENLGITPSTELQQEMI